jgi:hypothetical protein
LKSSARRNYDLARRQTHHEHDRKGRPLALSPCSCSFDEQRDEKVPNASADLTLSRFADTVPNSSRRSIELARSRLSLQFNTRLVSLPGNTSHGRPTKLQTTLSFMTT